MRTCPLLIGLMAVALLVMASGTAAASAGVVSVSAAFAHTVVLLDDGTVWTWGWADTPWGILGTGSDQSDGGYRQVTGLPRIVAIDASFKTSLAIDADGRVWAWGDNEYGQCGNEGSAAFFSPVRIDGLSNIVQVSCGGINCAALDSDGHVWTWGDNKYGQLGAGGAYGKSYRPIRVNSVDNVKMVAAGNGYTVVLKNDGTVWAWGENDLGMAGAGDKSNVLRPQQIQGLSDIVKIDAGYDHTLALRKDGTVWGWGDGAQNKIGNGQGFYDTVAVRTAARCSGLSNIVDVQASDQASMALAGDGSVYGWGSAIDGQFGNSVDISEPAGSPVKVPGLTDVVAIAAGYGHRAVIKKDGSVWMWGRNQEDQIQPGLGKKVLAPVKKLEGSGTTVVQQPTIPPAATGSTETGNSDIATYITIGGVALLALAVGVIGLLLYLRKR
ncbi:MAG: Regulator of chromosome condensation (RCC1) repeat protein [Methanocella sp. PtaU1.Bin125]|nr:MAG: Regulator of chromosome condensation (RCC1) repeat protein [Methanocella sp. PtaU1.Bin125]